MLYQPDIFQTEVIIVINKSQVFKDNRHGIYHKQKLGMIITLILK